MSQFWGSYFRPFRSIRSTIRQRIESLEDRSVPAALSSGYDFQSIAVGFYTGNPLDPVRTQALPLTPGQSPEQALLQWQQAPGVAYAELNHIYSVGAIPNDTSFGLQYAQNNTGQSGGTVDADMDAPEGWDVFRGSLKTTVAVIDTGVDYTHPDLYLNVWINQAEISATVRAALTDVDGDGRITFWDLNNSVNIGSGKITDLNSNGRIDGGDLLRPVSEGGWADGIDNGANGYIDDLVGWDFVGNDNDPMDLTAENGGHGTHVAGTIGAIGNNGIGVAGVAWTIQMMPIRFLGASGGSSTAAAAAIRYSAANGAVVSNNSWGGTGYSQSIYDAINYARGLGQVFVAAAGNSGTNNDTTAFYPSNYALDNVVSVAATNRFDQLASFSNFGRSTVDLGAGGVDIASTYPNNQYVYMSGTSMAAPQVAGAFALVRGQNPTLGHSQAISRVLGSVDPIAALSTNTVTGGRLNLYKALTSAPPDITGTYITGMTPNATGSSPVSAVRVTFSEQIAAATFTTADLSVTGPGGVAVAVTGVVPVGTSGTQFDITFASQSAEGTYTVRVGPAVADLSGNLMDQDRDGVNGETTQDQFSGTFSIAPASNTWTYSNSTALSIQDRKTVISRITIDRDLTISDLNVLVNLTHTAVGQLSISLRAPDGTIINLFSNRGGTGDNLTSTVFNDEAGVAIAQGSAPFTGSFRPEQLLSRLDGKNARGTWELQITDNTRGDIGQLRNWTLYVTTGNAGTLSVAGGLDLRPISLPAAPRTLATPALPTTLAPAAAVAQSDTRDSAVSRVMGWAATVVPSLPGLAISGSPAGMTTTAQRALLLTPVSGTAIDQLPTRRGDGLGLFWGVYVGPTTGGLSPGAKHSFDLSDLERLS